jgi:hypothetical protein
MAENAMRRKITVMAMASARTNIYPQKLHAVRPKALVTLQRSAMAPTAAVQQINSGLQDSSVRVPLIMDHVIQKILAMVWVYAKTISCHPRQYVATPTTIRVILLKIALASVEVARTTNLLQ